MITRKRKPRVCDTCGNPYHRRNCIEVWDVRNPGHTLGWHKTVIKQCLTCATMGLTRRVLMVAHVKIPSQKAS